MLRKISVALLSAMCFLWLIIGCSKSNSLTSIQVGDKIISYDMTQSDAENLIGKGKSLGLPPDQYVDDEIEYNKSLRIAYKDHKIRYFEIDEPNIKTYNSIQVGNSLADVLTKYKYEQDKITKYMVAFYNNNEVDASNSKQKIDYWIGYCYQHNTVTAIQIYDNDFSKSTYVL